MPGNDFFVFGGGGAFFLTYIVSFTKIICINMPHRLNVSLLAFFVKFSFLAF